ncbi:hypothetical protein M0805_007562 [Coniferiporia weirii]|nr:hypothetical protein M0805_007562 [Coniferiporia weirii]
MIDFKSALKHFRTADDVSSVNINNAKGMNVQEIPLIAPDHAEQTTSMDSDSLSSDVVSLEDDVAGGMGRHLGVFSCTLLIVGRVIGAGIFSTPSSILISVHSVGASLMLWVFGFVLSFAGLFVYLEFGTMFPRSGGEKVYLEAVYTRPKYLATVFYATLIILLGFTSSDCIVFAQNILISAGQEPAVWAVRGIAIGVQVFATIIHGFAPKQGVWLMNALSVFKLFILTFIVITGWVVLGGHTRVQDPHANFRNAFAGSSHSGSDYATAMFKVLNAYEGWSNINYVMSEVRNPVRTLKIAGPLGLGVCSIMYVLANVAYFAAATKEEILNSGVAVAALFFEKVFGPGAERALTVFVALRCSDTNGTLPNFRLPVHKTFAQARVNQELAKEGIPLPFGNKFWASNWPTGKTPMPGLIIHLIPSLIVIIAPPFAVAYPFILDLQGYPSQFVGVLIVSGLLYFRWSRPNAVRPFKVWWPFTLFSLAASMFLLIVPFLRPSNGVGDTPPLPYYLYCLVSIAIMILGVVYWAVWRKMLPRMFNYELVPKKEVLPDGTLVTVFERRKLE